MDEARLLELARDADAVVDASDNFSTRYAINRAMYQPQKATGIGRSGAFRRAGRRVRPSPRAHPCYHCLFPEMGKIRICAVP